MDLRNIESLMPFIIRIINKDRNTIAPYFPHCAAMTGQILIQAVDLVCAQ
jgi:hypothetical protein